jgi:hypothetical protein
MAKQGKAARAIDARVSQAFRVVSDRIQIPILELCMIYQTGRDAIARGATDLELLNAIKAHVDRVRVSAGGDESMTIEHITIDDSHPA